MSKTTEELGTCWTCIYYCEHGMSCHRRSPVKMMDFVSREPETCDGWPMVRPDDEMFCGEGYWLVKRADTVSLMGLEEIIHREALGEELEGHTVQ